MTTEGNRCNGEPAIDASDQDADQLLRRATYGLVRIGRDKLRRHRPRKLLLLGLLVLPFVGGGVLWWLCGEELTKRIPLDLGQ